MVYCFAEVCVYNSTNAFQENNLGMVTALEGEKCGGKPHLLSTDKIKASGLVLALFKATKFDFTLRGILKKPCKEV